MYRHGDLIIIPVAELPANCKKQQHLTLAHGEVTGHTHRIAEVDSADLYALADQFFLHVTAEQALVVHEEHRPIPLPQGHYMIRHQREYTPQRILRVVD